jgi:Trypsin-like peptidase domain/Tetratricopeptide repeat
MTINHITKNAGLRAMCTVIFVFLQHIAVPYVYAGTPAVLRQEAALVTIYAGNTEGGHASTGKGFFIDKSGIIAIQYKLISGKLQAPGTVLFVRTEDGSYLQIKQIAAVDKAHGIALLKVDLADPPIMTLFPDHSPVSGESIFIAGSRSNIRDTVIEGKTALPPDGREVILFTSPVPPEISGSPACNSEGKVIGMVARETEGGTVVNRLVSAAYIAGLLDEYRKSEPQQHGDLSTTEEETGPGPEELERELEKAKSLVEQDPDSAKAFAMLGWAYSRLGMYADAIEAYKGASRLRPDAAGIYNNIGVIYGMNMGMYDKAIAEFEKALQLKPDYDEARYNLAIAYVFSDNTDSALKQYRKLKKTDPERAVKLFELIYEQRKEEDRGDMAR